MKIETEQEGTIDLKELVSRILDVVYPKEEKVPEEYNKYFNSPKDSKVQWQLWTHFFLETKLVKILLRKDCCTRIIDGTFNTEYYNRTSLEGVLESAFKSFN